MELPEDVVDDVRKRLRRVAGQVQGIERMLGDGRECRDILTQLSAATRALEQAGFKLVAAGLAYCLDNPDQAEADGYGLEEIERLFLRLA
ncbi:MAG: metal-sensitive transcriptional regulator [Acidimicrobiales bacterium]|jgi:DNA-binding FrmR family transcriptional regulator